MESTGQTLDESLQYFSIRVWVDAYMKRSASARWVGDDSLSGSVCLTVWQCDGALGPARLMPWVRSDRVGFPEIVGA
jgi:hypothetical protein